METHVTGQPVLGELRQHVLMPLIGHPLFSEAEQLRANHFVHECEDTARLMRWRANVLAEIARRRVAAAHQRGQHSLRATLRRMDSPSFRGHLPRQPRPVPTWAPSAALPDRADRWAGTFDRQGVVRFQPKQSLTLAYLLARPQR